MLALFGNLNLMELVVIAGVALLVFGGRLPEVLIRGARHVGKLRRSLEKIWREAGIEQEMRDLRREIDVSAQTMSGAQKSVHTALDPYTAKSFQPSFDPAAEAGGDPVVSEAEQAPTEMEGVDPGSLGPPATQSDDAAQSPAEEPATESAEASDETDALPKD